jgi:hypothetical protein
MKDLKEFCIFILYIMLVLIAIGIALWGIFNLFELIYYVPPPPAYVEPRDFQLCRNKGGIPISSSWDGSLKRCDVIK